jgi:hypothetical protein
MNDTDQAKRRHEMARADLARAVLDNALFKESFEAIEQELITRWKTDASLNPDGRERVFLMVTLLNQVRQVLTQHLQTGEMARMQLQAEKTRREKLKDGLRSIRGFGS